MAFHSALSEWVCGAHLGSDSPGREEGFEGETVWAPLDDEAEGRSLKS